MSGYFSIDLKIHVREATRYLSRAERVVIPKAMARTLNRITQPSLNVIVKQITQVSRLNRQRIKRKLFVAAMARPNNTSMFVIVRARPGVENLIEWVAPSKRNPKAFRKRDRKGNYRFKGVKSSAWQRNKEYKGAFIGRGQTSGKLLVFARTGPKRTAKLKALRGPSVRHLFKKFYRQGVLRREILKRFPREFERNLKFYISKLK